jgi:hypothetical protein
MVPDVAARILQLADGILDLALDLLSGAFDFSAFIAGQISDVALGASNDFVNRAFHSVLVHFSTSVD